MTISNLDLKLEKLKIKAERERLWLNHAANISTDLLKNPVFELAAGSLLIAYLMRHQYDGPWYQDWAAAAQQLMMEGGLIGVITAQQLAPALPYLLQGTSEAIGALGKTIPLLGGL